MAGLAEVGVNKVYGEKKPVTVNGKQRTSSRSEFTERSGGLCEQVEM